MNIGNSAPRDPGQPEKGPVFNAVVECMRAEGFPTTTLPDAPSVKASVNAPAGQLTVFAHIDESVGKVVFRARLDEVTVPVGRRVAVHNMVSLINGQANGKFTLGFDGVLYFETFTAVDVEVLRALRDDQLRSRLFRPLFRETYMTANAYTASVIAVIEGDEAIDLTQFDQVGLHRVLDVIAEASKYLDY